eukprot:3340313-Ditylum_brightwellii.AAC.1
MILFHVMSMVSFYSFKNNIFMWLAQNQNYITKTIFSSRKETVQCLGHLINVNSFRIDCAGFQELISDILIGAATEKVQSNENFLMNSMQQHYT